MVIMVIMASHLISLYLKGDQLQIYSILLGINIKLYTTTLIWVVSIIFYMKRNQGTKKAKYWPKDHKVYWQ